MKRKAIIFLAVCLATKFGFEEVGDIFYFNVTSSLPMGLYMRIPNRECRRGDYIVYEPSEEVKAMIIENGW